MISLLSKFFYSLRLKEGQSVRFQTDGGLDTRLFNEGIEIESKRIPFGIDIQIAETGYEIRFYKPEGDVKTIMPGIVYLDKNGVLIDGCEPTDSERRAFIDYRGRH